MFFTSNIKMLRKRKGRTQDDVATALDMKRSTLSGYENSVAQPGIEELWAFSDYYKISIDTLVKVDLSAMPESQLSQLERGFDTFIRGSKLRVLATTVNRDNEENIEMVAEKAKAGYQSGFADPDYISVLPAFHLPFLSREKKYRSFQISGDSMLPIPDGSFVTGEYVQNWEYIRSKHAYIVLTLNDGIVFKVIENRIKQEGRLRMFSLNPMYEPFDVDVAEVREVWKFVNYINDEFPEPQPHAEALLETVKNLKREIEAIQLKLNLQ
jgi:transcriptional regulator with XRE-family HTH domain